MKCEDVENIVNKFMLLEDKGIVKLLCAYVMAIRLPIPPPWLFIIGSSSGGKSMLLNALAKVSGYAPLDDATSNTFLSGMKRTGIETSYLNTLKRNSFIVFKDFTTILSKSKEQKTAIIGLLRKIYDGEMSKRTGQGDTLDWESKIGVLGASTSTFHTKMAEFSDMGERIVLYDFRQPDRLELGKWILDGKSNDFEAKEAMRIAFKEYLDEESFKELLKTTPQLDTNIQNDLLDLSDLTTTARSAVERDQFSRDKRMIAIHKTEQIARFLKELLALAYGLVILNQHDGLGAVLLPKDRAILYHIALSSIPMTRMAILRELTRYGQATIQQISIRTHMDHDYVKIVLHDLDAHGMLIRTARNISTELYALKDRWKEILVKFEHIKEEPVQIPPSIPTEYIPEPSEVHIDLPF